MIVLLYAGGFLVVKRNDLLIFVGLSLIAGR